MPIRPTGNSSRGKVSSIFHKRCVSRGFEEQIHCTSTASSPCVFSHCKFLPQNPKPLIVNPTTPVGLGQSQQVVPHRRLQAVNTAADVGARGAEVLKDFYVCQEGVSAAALRCSGKWVLVLKWNSAASWIEETKHFRQQNILGRPWRGTDKDTLFP